MQEHFIPQDISNYRFHLIGELDLKQFLEIIVGVGISVLIYQFNWPAIIKWPLIIVIGGTGLVAAFLPIADQPLSHWIKVFFHNLFSATRFYWFKNNPAPSYFTYELPDDKKSLLSQQDTFNTTPVKKHKALDYFDTLEKKKDKNDDQLEFFSQQKLNSVLSSLEQEKPKVENLKSSPKKVIIKPQLKTAQSQRARQIITPSQENVEAFLNKPSLFQPSAVTETITAVRPDFHKSSLSWPIKESVAPAQMSNLEKLEPPILNLHKQFNLSGKVVDKTNHPLDNVVISLKDINGNLKAVLRTNFDGDFLDPESLDPGNYLLNLQKNDYAFTETLLNVEDQGIIPLLLTAS